MPWPVQSGQTGKSPYDARPDDPVIAEAASGDAFITAHKLMGVQPLYEKAIASINAINRPENPSEITVSIIIPVYGQLPYTLNCLEALLRHKSRYSFEILIGDDASKDESETWLSQVKGVRYLRYTSNEGFIHNCNKTAAKAIGQYLVFLNNDTRVVEGWLDGLIDSFALKPQAGYVGSKLFYPDGSLQEAGGIVWQDGSGWNYGRNDDPNRPRYCYARQCDYVSGCSIATPAELWRKLGGFDTYYAPAYYEDTDYAFRVREQGREVWFQPASRIIHYEGKSSGTDITQGVKASQVVNQKRFYERWAATLATHRPNGQTPWLERERDTKKRVLILDLVNPTPRADAGSAATVNLMKAYMALGYHVLFVPEDNFLYEREPVGELQKMGVECLYAPYELGLTHILTKYAELIDVIHLIRPQTAGRALDLIDRLAPGIPVLYLNADLHYLRLQRQAEVEQVNRDPEIKALKEEELSLFGRVDCSMVHSTEEMRILKEEGVTSPVCLLPLIETDFGRDAGYEPRHDIMFLGGYRHTPNLDAAMWLITDLWPRIHARHPEAKLLIVGSSPPQSLKDMASSDIIVTGAVDDLKPWFERSRVFMAPLRYGAGAKGKLVAALAHGVPIVATSIAVEGMSLSDGETARVADEAEDLIKAAMEVYENTGNQWHILSEAGLAFASENHDFQASVTALERALVSAGRATGG